MDLRNKFLLATRKIKNKIYRDSIVYIISHDIIGSIGVIINKKLNYIIRDLSNNGYNIALDKLFPEDLYFGGCNNMDKNFLLYLDNNNNIFHIISNEVIHNIPSNYYLVIVGQIIWNMGELEEEIMEGQWIVINANYDIIYNKENYLKLNSLVKYIGANDLSFFDWSYISANIQ